MTNIIKFPAKLGSDYFKPQPDNETRCSSIAGTRTKVLELVMIKFIANILFPQTVRTLAELPKEQFLTYRAVTQGNQIARGCIR